MKPNITTGLYSYSLNDDHYGAVFPLDSKTTLEDLTMLMKKKLRLKPEQNVTIEITLATKERHGMIAVKADVPSKEKLRDQGMLCQQEFEPVLIDEKEGPSRIFCPRGHAKKAHDGKYYCEEHFPRFTLIHQFEEIDQELIDGIMLGPEVLKSYIRPIPPAE